jgi:lysozyme family protein
MTFERAFEIVVGLEGGYGNDSDDPGGETKYGISKRAYPDINIKTLTLDQAKSIYRFDYWEPLRCDELPWPLSMMVFDCGVNQGLNVSAKTLQKTLNVTQDGIIGNVTLAKAKNAGDETCALFLADRSLRYTGTRNFDKYGRGWLKRLFLVAMEA